MKLFEVANKQTFQQYWLENFDEHGNWRFWNNDNENTNLEKLDPIAGAAEYIYNHVYGDQSISHEIEYVQGRDEAAVLLMNKFPELKYTGKMWRIVSFPYNIDPIDAITKDRRSKFLASWSTDSHFLQHWSSFKDKIDYVIEQISTGLNVKNMFKLFKNEEEILAKYENNMRIIQTRKG